MNAQSLTNFESLSTNGTRAAQKGQALQSFPMDRVEFFVPRNSFFTSKQKFDRKKEKEEERQDKERTVNAIEQASMARN